MLQRFWKQCFPGKGSISLVIAVGRPPDCAAGLLASVWGGRVLLLELRSFGEGCKQVKGVRHCPGELQGLGMLNWRHGPCGFLKALSPGS